MTAKKKVLILCTGNSAAVKWRKGCYSRCGERFEVKSAGVAPTAVKPEAIEAMRKSASTFPVNVSKFG
jgi:protein-tyrosine-phosphatase